IRSRTSTRRSWANGAPESSIDSFWHTMQRKSLDSARARASKAGSDSISPGSTAQSLVGANSAISSISACRYFTALTPRPAARFWPSPAAARRHAAAEKHDDGAEPDHQHMRLEEQPHRHGAVRIRVAERQIKLAETARHQR